MASSPVLESTRELALQLIESLPEGFSWEDLLAAVRDVQAIERGLADMDAGRTIAAAEVKRDFGIE